MAEKPNHRAAVMSLHPEFAHAILEGRKKAEFRRVAPSSDVTHIIIYATKPVGKVVGVFEVEGFDEGSPSELWQRFGQVGGISRPRFDRYFRGRRGGVAIRVGHKVKFASGLDLKDAVGLDRAPQSFAYVSPDALTRLVEHYVPT